MLSVKVLQAPEDQYMTWSSEWLQHSLQPANFLFLANSSFRAKDWQAGDANPHGGLGRRSASRAGSPLADSDRPGELFPGEAKLEARKTLTHCILGL